MTLDEFLELKKECESLRRRAGQAEGAFGQLSRRLKEEFGIKTEKEAVKVFAETKAEAERLSKKVEQEWKKWREKWEKKLEVM